VTSRIRIGGPHDAAAIARVHVDSWRTTYRGIVPDQMLATLSYEQRETFWQDTIERQTQGIFVAEMDGEVVGFASCGSERTQNPIYTGELYAIYLLQQAQRRGLGRELVHSVVRWLLEQAHTAMLIWVLEQNPARRFYEALGGQSIERKTLAIGGINFWEVAYGWSDLASLK
jgi:GNAT superfamily N-acetyltransferase